MFSFLDRRNCGENGGNEVRTLYDSVGVGSTIIFRLPFEYLLGLELYL
jgi:hypothetical protein